MLWFFILTSMGIYVLLFFKGEDMSEEKDVKIEFCLGKESQETSNYAELMKHAGHKIQVVSFPRGPQILKAAMECLTCNKVLIEYDNPNYEQSDAL